MVLLGPQRLQPMLAEAVDALGQPGRIATITAGWEEREGDDEELSTNLGNRDVNLRLYERAESLFEAHPEVLDAHRVRRDRRARLRELYRIRLAHALDAARELITRRAERGGEPMIDQEIADAISEIRDLDQHHVDEVRRIRDEEFARSGVLDHPDVASARADVANVLDDCDAVVIAGGHVRVLLDVLLLFDLRSLLAERSLIAWSAGAMAIGTSVVLFHDSPPQGAGNAETSAPGLALHEGLLPLPHATRRLTLDDPDRVGLFASRFAPANAIAMDEGAWLHLSAGRLTDARGVQRLELDGSVTDFGTPIGATA